MPSFEIKADIFSRLSVFDSPKGSSNTFKTHKNISLYFKRRYLIIIYYQVPSFEIQADILRVLKVFDEPLGESNTERRVKISAGISKEGT